MELRPRMQPELHPLDLQPEPDPLDYTKVRIILAGGQAPLPPLPPSPPSPPPPSLPPLRKRNRSASHEEDEEHKEHNPVQWSPEELQLLESIIGDHQKNCNESKKNRKNNPKKNSKKNPSKKKNPWKKISAAYNATYKARYEATSEKCTSRSAQACRAMADRLHQRYNPTPKKNKCKVCGEFKRGHICKAVANHTQEDDPGTQEGDLRIEEHDLCTQENDVWNLLAEGVVDPVFVLGTNTLGGLSSLEYQAILHDEELKVLDPAFVLGTNTLGGLSFLEYQLILHDEEFLKILINADPTIVPWTSMAL